MDEAFEATKKIGEQPQKMMDALRSPYYLPELDVERINKLPHPIKSAPQTLAENVQEAKVNPPQKPYLVGFVQPDRKN